MRGQQRVRIVQPAVFNDGMRPAHAFLRRLENQLHRTMQYIPVRHQNARNPQADGRVPIVAACVHHAGVHACKALPRRPVCILRTLRYRQRVDVKPHRDRGPLAASQNRDHARIARANVGRQLVLRRALRKRLFSMCR